MSTKELNPSAAQVHIAYHIHISLSANYGVTLHLLVL